MKKIINFALFFIILTLPLRRDEFNILIFKISDVFIVSLFFLIFVFILVYYKKYKYIPVGGIIFKIIIFFTFLVIYNMFLLLMHSNFYSNINSFFRLMVHSGRFFISLLLFFEILFLVKMRMLTPIKIQKWFLYSFFSTLAIPFLFKLEIFEWNPWKKRLILSFSDPNYLALYMVLIFSMVLYIEELSFILRLILLSFTTGIIIFTYSRTGLIILFFSIIYFGARSFFNVKMKLRKKNIYFLINLFLLSGILILMFIPFTKEQINLILERLSKAQIFADSRAILWRYYLTLIFQFPLGIGIGGEEI